METHRNHGAGGREQQLRMSVWISCMVVVLTASGCSWCKRPVQPPGPTNPTTTPEPLATDGCPGGALCGIDAALMAGITDCPTGGCDPDHPNGRGIFTAENSNYCFKAFGDPEFCPEDFVNTPQGVVLEVRHLNKPSNVNQLKVFAKFKATPTATPVAAEVLAIQGDRTRLSIKYRVAGKEYTATDSDLSKLTLSIGGLELLQGEISIAFNYELRLSPTKQDPTKPDDGVHRYKLLYRDADALDRPENWYQHCQGEGDPAGTSVVSFLSGQRVSGVNATVTDDPNVTTMGCETGAVVTCLAWGYTPWDKVTGQRDMTRDYVYRSCLQAKRAAYFVGKGDLRAYTVKGTLIDRRDQLGINKDQINYLEAIWSPQGVVCFNKDHRRRPDAEDWKGRDPEQLMKQYNVGDCSTADWSEQGKLATGPVELLQP